MKKNINRAISFIKSQQKKDDGFWSWSSLDRNNFDKAKKYNSIFPSVLILSCLDSIEKSEKIKKKLVDFLLSQKSDYWSFNYWKRQAKESKRMPYPDDLDDTFCALSGIYKYDSKLIDGAAMAKIVTLLTTMEKKEGGPYKTWLVSESVDEAWKDVDLAVNSNIGYFLSLQEIELENINKLIKLAIEKKDLISPYYPSIYPIVYFISRFFFGKTECKKLVKIILMKKNDDNWGNPLDTALAISALLNLGMDPKKVRSSINYLIKNQKKNGSWKTSAFCIDPAINRETYYAGSMALTTAFCVEALNKYFLKTVSNLVQKKDKVADEIHQEILQIANNRTKFLSKIPERNCKKSITLLPYIFYKSLGKNGEKVSKKLIVQCGLANLYGWIAYTIYDDFLDGDGDKKTLSMANVCLRELALIYNSILPKTDFADVFNKTMDEIDVANYWEVVNCYDDRKLPNYGDYFQLAKKSLGHALGSVAILYSLGFNKNSPEVKNVWSFFKHYLISRQLNDDAHDWEDDLKKGFINPAAVEIFKKTTDKKNFKEIFWKEVLIEISNIILKNINKAKKNIIK
ncbi:MAG: hypothetical protein PHS06_04470, partial [Candidatus Shapirobacteria bacterium]|nr:hypothetical protein [Candidatus Shapirobacteria bacterium]